MKRSSAWPFFASLALVGAALLSGCDTSRPKNEPFVVSDWTGKWEGVQPQYAMLDAQDQLIYIQGQAAQVKSSTFVFSLHANGRVALTQSVADGRMMEFQGRWNAMESKNTLNPNAREQLVMGVNCELSSSTGAYRNYILLADTVERVVRCYGTPREPHFDLTPSIQP